MFESYNVMNSQTVTIRTAVLMTAIDMASLIDSYCTVYTDNPHSRLTGIKRFSNSQMQVMLLVKGHHIQKL